MGFLDVGVPMKWEDTEEYYKVLEYVLIHGPIQFLKMFNKIKDRRNDVLKWGDEIEYHLFEYDEKEKRVKIKCIAHELLAKLNEEDKTLNLTEDHLASTWHPEFGAWMIEATPGGPYGKHASDLLNLEKSLRYRRYRIQNVLKNNEGLCSLPAWPRMGCEGFVNGFENVLGPQARSNYLPDEIINPHPRFGTLAQNIRLRRGRNVEIHLPVFKDTKTDVSKLNNKLSNLAHAEEILQKEEIYMDGMGFGMGCCCLQVTFQARDLKESRYLYDQLAVLCPIFLALSAGSPIFKGILADTDCRWDVISGSVDCRTPVEYGKNNASSGQRGSGPIRKSRYASIDLFISDALGDKYNFYNDVNAEINQNTLKFLVENGVDEILARHVAHLFIRDPLVIFSDRINVDDDKTTEHFENIQSTNWQTMRWKPPPATQDPNHKDAIGWRVEFRPMESQLTDFENAAYTIAIVLLSRVILFFNLNFYVPISKIDENMTTAQKRDAVLNEKFHFRKNLVPLEADCDEESKLRDEDEFEMMTVAEILNGKGENFPGIFPLIYAYLDIIDCDEESYEAINTYLQFLGARSEGKVKTLSRWIRDFVAAHPDYKQDSMISAKIEADLVLKVNDISNGRIQDDTLLGNNIIEAIANPLQAVKEEKVENRKMKLRGASFSESFHGLNQHKKQSECQVVLDLIKKYSGKKNEFIISGSSGFSATPAFLN